MHSCFGSSPLPLNVRVLPLHTNASTTTRSTNGLHSNHCHHQVRNFSSDKKESKRRGAAASSWLKNESSASSSETSEAEAETKKKSGWFNIKNIFGGRKKSKKAAEEASAPKGAAASEQKKPKSVRPGKTPMPSPEAGVMQHIPREKAQILHILQNECDLYPDEVFPLFPDNKVEDILVEYQERGDEAIEFASITRAISDKRVEDDGTIVELEDSLSDTAALASDDTETTLLDESQRSETSETSETSQTSQEKGATGRHALARIETAQIAAEDAIDSDETESDKKDELLRAEDRGDDTGLPVTIPLTASQRRQQKMSQISLDTRHQRELDPHVTFRETKILSPDEVSLLHKKKEDTTRRMESLAKYESELARKQMEKKNKIHAVWKQDPDNVYEIVQLLTEHGFKSDQTDAVWPYNEFEMPSGLKGETEDIPEDPLGEFDESETGSNEEVSASSLVPLGKKVNEDGSTGLNPAPNKFNDFYLLFSRFPEILTMELNDIRRKLYVLQQFTISDIRIVILKDPRFLRRPAHHLRMMLEILDEYYVEDFNLIIETCPYLLASTSKKELKKRLHLIYNNILRPQQFKANLEAAEEEGVNLYASFQGEQLDLDMRTSGFSFNPTDGTVTQNEMERSKKDMRNRKGPDRKHINNQVIYENNEHELIKQLELKLNDEEKKAVARFIDENPDVIGSNTYEGMKRVLWVLRKLGIKGELMEEMLKEYPQVLTVSPKQVEWFVKEVKKAGVRDVKQYIVQNVHELAVLGGPSSVAWEVQQRNAL